MHRFDWSDLATSDLLDHLRAAAGSGADDGTLRPLVTAILCNTGGLPVADSDWPAAHRAATGARLVQEAIGHALSRAGHTAPLPGTLAEAADANAAPLTHVLKPVARIDANTDDAKALEALPVLGPALTERLIESRRADGPFLGPGDLAERVSGLGPAGAAQLAGLLSFSDPGQERSVAKQGADLATDLKHFLEHHVAGGDLVRGLERLAVLTAETPHPAARAGRRRSELEPDAAGLPAKADAAPVELLEDAAYLPRLLTLLAKAQTRVDVAMFFMSWSGNDHPNAKVVEALAAAKANGAAVRVLLDRDRPEDPYGSEIINAQAAAKLKDKGIDVRMDPRERLLHSKVIAIDSARLIVGSHNWTRSSYETYQDVSVVLHSAALTGDWQGRFDALWAEGEAP